MAISRQKETRNWEEWTNSNTRHWPKVGLMLAYRLRRWPNISPTLGQALCIHSFTPLWDAVLRQLIHGVQLRLFHHLRRRPSIKPAPDQFVSWSRHDRRRALRYNNKVCHKAQNVESCVWMEVLSYSSHHPQEVPV